MKENTIPSGNCKCPSRSKAREQSGEKVNRNLVPEGSFYSGRLGESLKEHVANNHDPYLRMIHHSGRNWREASLEQGERGRLSEIGNRVAVAVRAERSGEKVGRGF